MSLARRQFPSRLAWPAASSHSVPQWWPQWLGWGTAGQAEMPGSTGVYEAQAQGALLPKAKGLFLGLHLPCCNTGVENS